MYLLKQDFNKLSITVLYRLFFSSTNCTSEIISNRLTVLGSIIIFIILLYITYNWFSPAYKAGGPSQSLQQLAKHLSREQEGKVLCAHEDHDGSEIAVPANSWVPFLDKSFVWYSSKITWYRWILFIRKQPAKVWFINGIYSLRFNLIPLLFGKGRKVISPRGMLDPGSISQKYFQKKIYLFFWKLLGFHRSCLFHAASEVEADNIRSFFGNGVRVSIVPNLPREMDYQPMPFRKNKVLQLVTVALINPVKNYALVLESLLYCKYPLQYDIYGPIHHDTYWKQCEVVIDKMPSHIQVNYHGDIHPDAVAAVLTNAHVYIQPSRSENFGHSLFEAFSVGRPVITSFQTPWNDLLRQHAGINVEVKDTGDITEAIEFFATMDDDTLCKWSVSSNIYAKQKIDMQNIREAYHNLFFLND